MLALLLPDELNPFLWELTADPHCSEKALRQLEESNNLTASDTAGRASLLPTSPSRGALFAIRVQLAEAALQRIPALAAGHTRARPARTEKITESLPAPDAPGAPFASPRPQTTSPDAPA